jgi:hypothetical protein
MNLQARIEHFFTLGETFFDPKNEDFQLAKQKAFQQNSWFLPVFMDHATSQIKQSFLSLDALKHWANKYPSLSNEPTGKKVGIVMAGNIPLVGFHDLLSTLIAGHTAVVKLSSKDTVLMKYVIESLIEINPAFEKLIIQQEQLKNCDAYIATGSNNTGRYFEQYFGKYPHIIRKNKTSIAILNGQESKAELDLLADDMLLYFGMGCRNVTQIWVPEGYDFIPLLEAMKKYNYLGDEHKYKHNYDYQLALLMMNRQFYMDTGGILLSENPSPFAALSQIHYQFYTPGKIPTIDSSEIQCIVGQNGIAFGGPQKPSLLEYADGVDTLEFLSKIQ